MSALDGQRRRPPCTGAAQGTHTDSFISLHDPGHSHLGLTPSAADSELGQSLTHLSGPLLPAVLLSRTPDCALEYFSHLQKHLEMRLFLASARDKNSL